MKVTYKNFEISIPRVSRNENLWAPEIYITNLDNPRTVILEYKCDAKTKIDAESAAIKMAEKYIEDNLLC